MSHFPDMTGLPVSHLQAALDRVRPQMQALKDSELLAVNLDPLAAVSVARGALPRLMALRETLANTIGSFDLANLDQLELYALALTQAQTVYQGVNTRAGALALLADEADTLRARLLLDVTVLVRRGQIHASSIAKLKRCNGYRNIASDLLTLAAILRNGWREIAGRTAATLDELECAERLGDQLVTAIGMRRHSLALTEAAARERQQIYTLFVRAYDELRRAFTYLRWHAGDVDQLVPSLYAKRKGSRKKHAAQPIAADANEPATAVDAVVEPAAPHPAFERPTDNLCLHESGTYASQK